MADLENRSARKWHWVESDHWELQFHGLPRRVPWLDGDAPPPATSYPNPDNKEFPVLRLYEAVEAMVTQEQLAEGNPPVDPRFIGFMRIIETGEEFGSAMERGDFIAAEGAVKKWELTGHECAYVLMNKAFIYTETDRAEEALPLYRRATEVAPDCEMMWMLYGERSEKAGNRAEAIRAYHAALRILPKHQEATLGLERLGELFRVKLTEGPAHDVWLSKTELRALAEKELEACWDDQQALHSFASQRLRENWFPDLTLRAFDRLLEFDPQNLEYRRNRGVALLQAGRAADALTALQQALELKPYDPWTLYHMAEVHLALQDVDSAWEKLDTVLMLDPNHRGALRLKFFAREDRTAEQKEQDVIAHLRASDERMSWCGPLLAANSAWKRGAKQVAVGYAAEAYKVAPENEEVFLTYTGMLGECGENEWVAALTKPRLRAGETSSRAYMNFANALDALGLREEAVATARRALAELKLSADEQEPIINVLDRWTQRFAESEIEVEMHRPGVLKRNLCQVRDGKPLARFFENGQSLPIHRKIPITFKTPKSEFDVTFEQRNEFDDPLALALGTFTVSEIEIAPLAESPVSVHITVTAEGVLSIGALQGDRKLKVTWALYPPPRVEPASPA